MDDFLNVLHKLKDKNIKISPKLKTFTAEK